MASIPFTLAALATSAVPGLEVMGVSPHDGDPAFASARIDTDQGELIVRVPRSEAAEVRQSAELLGLAALTEGSRTLLPFAVPQTLGMTRAGETRAVVSTSLPGLRFAVEDLAEDALLIPEIAKMLAAIHDLPTTVAHHGGLPMRGNRDLNMQARRLVDRADATRLLPQTVHERWLGILDTADIWDFSPTMVHGSLDASLLLVADDVVVGVEGWSEFGTGDPAVDFSWLLAGDAGVFDAIVPRYGRLRSAGSLTSLAARARLYRELEIARWLLHGVEAHEQEVVDDAVAMLDRLVDGLIAVPAPPARTALTEQEVEAMLDETPEVVDLLSDTAAYEALDEDRMFGVERAFVDDEGADAVDGASAAGTDSEDPDSTASAETDVMPDIRQGSGEPGRGSGMAGDPSADDLADHPTEPIDDEDLPR